jgi:hypothetical protein
VLFKVRLYYLGDLSPAGLEHRSPPRCSRGGDQPQKNSAPYNGSRLRWSPRLNRRPTCVSTLGQAFKAQVGDVRVMFLWYSGGTIRLHVEFSNHVMLLLRVCACWMLSKLLLLRDALLIVVAKSRLCSRQLVKSVSHASQKAATVRC